MVSLAASVAAAATSVAVVAVPLALRRPAARVDPKQIEASGGKWVRRPDGRLLEYKVIGEPNGTPVYGASAYGNCSAQYDLPGVKAYCKKNNLKFIAVSMPGFGLSDSYPVGVQRSLAEWPHDVLAVMEQERVEQFYVMGISTGCVHGCAVAHAVPDRILGMLLCTPTAPAKVEKEVGGIAASTAALKRTMLKPYFGDCLAFALARGTSGEKRLSFAPDIDAAWKRAQREGGEPLEAFQHMVKGVEFANGHTYRGWCDNMHTITTDLPFELSSLAELPQKRGIRIGISSAPDDVTNPPAFQKWFHEQIPGSTLLNVQSGWGHTHANVPGIFEPLMDFLLTGVYKQPEVLN